MKNNLFQFILVVLILGSTFPTESLEISCRHEKTGQAIDWFSLVKPPTDTKSSTPAKFLSDGTAYVYMTSESDTDWQLSSLSLNSGLSMAGLTLESYYKNKKSKSVGYVLYNDGFNGTGSSSRAHAKGVLLFTDERVVWIVHSFPEYPTLETYYLEHAQRKFAQSMLCATFHADQLLPILNQLAYFYPNVYASNLPEFLNGTKPTEYAMLELMAQGKRITKQQTNVVDLETVGGEVFTSFAKSSYFEKDLYADLLAPYANSDFAVQTWRNGNGGPLDSACPMNRNESVLNVNCTTVPVLNYLQYSYRNDHSKWAVSLSSRSFYSCVGDLNRMNSQRYRGGKELYLIFLNVCTNI